MLTRLLQQDAELLDTAFWRVFEVEGGGEVSMTRGEKCWTKALLKLTADDTVPRERVMRACLDALNRDSSAYRVGGFRRVYEAFEPSRDELARDQDKLWPLLACPLGPTVGWAVKQAEQLDGVNTWTMPRSWLLRTPPRWVGRARR
ncbi:MAG: DUF6493 family protein [Bifidobacteriaceae bacterium]|jgi:hypothetical protein|nr:DUF6493 family protein [Bifidobacteriaceae bacterium]